MGRSKPTIIVEDYSTSAKEVTQILEASTVYVIYYDNKPINIRKTAIYGEAQGSVRYVKSAFVNRGHANNLARKLNKQFKTDKFSVKELS